MDKTPPIPVQYGKSYLVSLVKNVHWLYVFWELTPEVLDRSYQELGSTEDSRIVLRVLQGSDPRQQLILADVTVSDNPGSHYLYIEDPGQVYQVQLTLVNSQRTVVVLSSNLVYTPYGRVSEVEDTQWVSIDELYQGYSNELANYSLSSPSKWHISSFQLQEHPSQEAELDLVVETEIVMYGKATPGANVYIQGEPISVAQDGSFSLRCALPNGTFVYPIKAVAPGGKQTKTTVPVITRETY